MLVLRDENELPVATWWLHEPNQYEQAEKKHLPISRKCLISLAIFGVADGARTTRQKGIENQGLAERSGVLCRQIRDTDS